jgi:hypothetical protein
MQQIDKMPEIKCESCPQLQLIEDGDNVYIYCKKLKHFLENGYAMIHHSQFCAKAQKSLKRIIATLILVGMVIVTLAAFYDIYGLCLGGIATLIVGLILLTTQLRKEQIPNRSSNAH